MPKGPSGEKRPADVIGAATKVAKARAEKMTPERRKELARKAVAKR